MATWKVGDVLPALSMCRQLINAEISPLSISVDSQDIIDDLIKQKTRALSTHVLNVMPKFMLKTPGMRRRAKSIGVLLERVESVHTPAQRAGCPRDLADDLLSLHTSDPQFLPESNLRFALSAPLIASVYLGDALSFALYAMASQPELYARIQHEADALFDDGDPAREDFTESTIDVTRRFIMESMRVHPIVPMSVRNVMNACVVEDYEIPEGSRVFIAQAAAHYVDDVFPDSRTFDIDRYLPPRNEHLSPGYAPFGLGTHTCLGNRWMELQLAVNLLLLAHHFTIEVSPANYKLKINPFPSLSPKKLKFAISERRREFPAWRAARPATLARSPACNAAPPLAVYGEPCPCSWGWCTAAIARSSSSAMRVTIERSRMFWYAPQTVIAGGTNTTETISEYKIVIAAVMPNCWDAASGEATSTPSPSAVVSAEPNSAEPVVASVRIAACSGSRRRETPRGSDGSRGSCSPPRSRSRAP